MNTAAVFKNERFVFKQAHRVPNQGDPYSWRISPMLLNLNAAFKSFHRNAKDSSKTTITEGENLKKQLFHLHSLDMRRL